MIGERAGDPLGVVVAGGAVSNSRSRCSLDGKWCRSPGSLSPTRVAIVASDAPWNPCAANTSFAAARIASRRSRPFAYPPRRVPAMAGA